MSHRFGAWARLAALACGLAASPAHAATVPLATFDRPLWSPDGTRLALEITMFRPEITLAAPSRVDTVLYDPLAGRFECVTPRVAAFALNARRDSILFADEYGAYVAGYPDVGRARAIVWRGPSSDYYVRELNFAADGRYFVYTGCFTQLSPGCWEKWIAPAASSSIPLQELRPTGDEPARYPAVDGPSPEYVRYQKRKTGPTLMDDLEPRAAFVQATSAAAGIAARGKGKAPAPRVEILFGREIPGDGRWIASVRLTRAKPAVVRVYTCLYDPRTRTASVLGEDVLASYLPVSPTEALYADTQGFLWRVRLAGPSVTRVRAVTSYVPAWADTLGPAGAVYAARVTGLDKPEKADQLVSSLVVKGYHGWPVEGPNETWGVSVGWFSVEADADSATAMLRAEGYEAATATVRPTEVRAAQTARPGRSSRVRVANGPLAGAEAMIEVSAGGEGPQAILYVRRKGEEPRSVLNGYEDTVLP